MVGELSARHRCVWLSLVLALLALTLTGCRWTPRSGASKEAARTERESTEVRSGDNADDRSRSRDSDSEPARRRGTVKVPLEVVNGVYLIDAKVNDVPMKFVFDTGASMISMSLVEANFMIKQGTLTEDDVIGDLQFVDANGRVSDGLAVTLRKVQLGDMVLHSVRASIVPNQEAPLLMGQSALQEFGSIKIDNKKRQLILEN